MPETAIPNGTRDRPLIVFFTEDQVARLVNLSVSTLRSWRQQGIISALRRPETIRGPYTKLYDYFGVVSLRLLAKLRKEFRVSLNEIKKTAQHLASLGENPWDRRITVLNGKVLFKHEDSGEWRHHTGQQVLDLKEIERETRRDVQVLLRRAPDSIGRISRQRNILGNASTVAGTRIKTSSIWNFYEGGYSSTEIQEQYPDLTLPDIEAAIAHERRLRTSAA